MKVKMASAPIPGLIIGRATSAKVRHSLAPSIRAASIISPNTFRKLLDQKYAKGPSNNGKDRCPKSIIQLQRRHFADQRDQNNLFWKCHSTYDQSKNNSTSDKAFFCQGITCHCCSDTGQKHCGNCHKNGIAHPAQRCRYLRPCKNDIGKRNMDFPKRGYLSAEQLFVVGHGPFLRPPLR